jgi:hypothetical protein
LRFLNSILSNPLFHFLLLALLIYVIYGFFGVKQNTVPERTILVTPSTINWLEESWEKRWNRPPTEEEMEGLINQYVRDNILYREALNLGLDKDDVIIRRRLAQKFEFLTQDLIQVPELSDKEIEEYFDENIDKYKAPDLVTFYQIYFDPDKRGNNTLTDAENSKTRLNGLVNPTEKMGQFGDKFMLQAYYPQRSEVEVSKYFGPEFAKSVFNLEEGEWKGPVLSGYGTHLVYVDARIEAPEPDLEPVKELVIEDLMVEKRQEINDKFFEDLIGRYEVIIEKPKDTPADKGQEQ